MSSPTAPATPASDPAKVPIPRQIPFIIGNEGCERFSFYGMRNILTVFLVSSLLMYLPEGDRAGAAKEVFHTFVIGVYFFPLLGGWLADRLWGKYNVIFWLSLVYCVGQGMLALCVDNRVGFYTGLFLIALGSGGIKPCISSFVGDQFDSTNKHRAKVVFDAFYWIINFGSFFASLLMPIFLKQLGPAVAFGIPGVLMFLSTVVLWAGRKKYVMVPPTPPDPHSFLRVCWTALMSGPAGKVLAALGVLVAALGFYWLPGFENFVKAVCVAIVAIVAFGGIGVRLQLEGARGAHPDAAVEGVRGVLRVLVLFALVTPFWSLFDQKASTWVLQGKAMEAWHLFDAAALRESSPLLATIFGHFATIEPSQMQALNPLFVMLLIPFNNLMLFPALRKIGFEVTALRRMTLGIAFAAASWVVIGWLQLSLDGGAKVNIAWQVLPYVLLTLGEVLVSATGLEFAYSQAPQSMKGALMSFWLLSVTIGNLWVLVANAAVKNDAVTGAIASTGFGVTAFQMFFFAAFAFVAAAIFGLVARGYAVKDHYRAA
ncbi:MAG: oligopeptide:H+ symporter [Candidatus Didemnitutus sp.]|nr:oligopeptide:H+ symporter [Candidatus Didemnitutus sp.]